MSKRPLEVVVLPPARGGRPRVVPEAGTTVCTWVSTRDHDRLIALAKTQRQSVSSLVRSLLQLRLARD